MKFYGSLDRVCSFTRAFGRHCHPWRRPVMAESSETAKNPVSAAVKFYVIYKAPVLVVNV